MVFLSNGLSLMDLIWTIVSLSDSVSETSLGVDNGTLHLAGSFR